MKNMKKKGFTLVELLVVIAIVAILAAVSVVGYTVFINRANESADIQAVTQMNTILSADGAVTPTTQGRLFEVLAEAGLNAKDYSPLYANRYFYWDKDLNRVLYVDENDNIIYPENATSSGKWYSLSGKINTAGGKDYSNTSLSTPTITMEIASGADFVKAAEFIRKQGNTLGAKTVEIVLNGDINLMGADVCFTQDSTQSLNVVFKSNEAGTQRTISGLYISDAHSTTGHDSDGNANNTYGHSLFNYINDLTVTDIIIADSTIGGTNASQSGFFAGQIQNGTFTNVDVIDCDVYGLNKVGVLFGYGHGQITLTDVNIDNCNVYAKDGEAGVVFGVAERSKVPTTELLVKVENVNITNCSVQIVAESKVVTAKDASNNEYDVVQVSETKWRVSTANIGFISDSNSPAKVSLDGANGEGALYLGVDTLDELSSIKGLK